MNTKYLSSTYKAILVLALLMTSLSHLHAQEIKNNKVLFVISSDDRGYWLPEVAEPYFILHKAGYEIDVASPKGGKGTQRGTGRMTNSLTKWLKSSKLNAQLNNATLLAQVDTSKYQAVYFAGGAGPMFDFVDNQEIHKVIREMYEAGGIIAADCHGPAALINVRLSNGKLLIMGRNITAKANDEEGWWARANYPYLLEDKIKELGGNFSAANKGQPHVVVDGQLITGQNPASATLVAEKMLISLSTAM